MGQICAGSCGGSGYLRCGLPCPACNAGGERYPCNSDAPFEGPYFRGMFTGEIPDVSVFENGGYEEE